MPSQMTSRQRVLATLNHREPDRVPMDFGGHRSSGIAAIVYPKLRKHLGLPPKPIRVYDLIQQLAIVDDDVPPANVVAMFDEARSDLTTAA